MSNINSARKNTRRTLGPTSEGFWAHPIRAVAFDMDGLLVNTETLYSEVGDTILRRRGKRFTSELKNKMMGLPGTKAFDVMIAHEGLTDDPQDLRQESDAVFEQLLPQRVARMPGVSELIDLLDQKQVPRCVATSSSRAFATQVLELVQLTRSIDFVVTAEDVKDGKPAPDIYQLAAEKFSIFNREMLVLEDSQIGCRAGVASGSCTVAVPGEHSRNHDFTGVAFIADTLRDARIREKLLSGEHVADNAQPN